MLISKLTTSTISFLNCHKLLFRSTIASRNLEKPFFYKTQLIGTIFKPTVRKMRSRIFQVKYIGGMQMSVWNKRSVQFLTKGRGQWRRAAHWIRNAFPQTLWQPTLIICDIVAMMSANLQGASGGRDHQLTLLKAITSTSGNRLSPSFLILNSMSPGISQKAHGGCGGDWFIPDPVISWQ